MQWDYIKGSESDFEGAPDWATLVTRPYDDMVFVEGHFSGAKYTIKDSNYEQVIGIDNGWPEIIAQRQPAAQMRRNDELLTDAVNKYARTIKNVTVDVYDVLKGFEVTDPALQHLIKKALCAGLRGHKTTSQDLQDIIDSAKRALELFNGK